MFNVSMYDFVFTSCTFLFVLIHLLCVWPDEERSYVTIKLFWQGVSAQALPLLIVSDYRILFCA